jgi:hypothetical protein
MSKCHLENKGLQGVSSAKLSCGSSKVYKNRAKLYRTRHENEIPCQEYPA